MMYLAAGSVWLFINYVAGDGCRNQRVAMLHTWAHTHTHTLIIINSSILSLLFSYDPSLEGVFWAGVDVNITHRRTSTEFSL